jgi:hypothetical protein
VRPYTEDEIREIILNPYYAVNFRSDLFVKHTPQKAKEDWVNTNANLMSKIGIRTWLINFLDAISSDDYNGDPIQNPYEAISIAQIYSGVHEVIVTRDNWLDANQKAIEESSSESWLSRLLDVLESPNFSR